MSQDSAKMGQDRANMPKDGAKIGQDGPRWHQDGPSCGQTERLGALLGQIWSGTRAQPGAMRRDAGTILGHLGAPLGALTTVKLQYRLKRIASDGRFSASWLHLGALLVHLARFGHHLSLILARLSLILGQAPCRYLGRTACREFLQQALLLIICFFS